jgi:demethylmenaquinone methyltransferase/2-methoxy-6-polyprenyl-1,4-benzoquinol methylase
MSDHMQGGIIPVWAGSLGSWNFSIGRRAFAARELEGHYDDASDGWHTTISKLGFEAAYAGLVEQALPEVATTGCAGPLTVLDAGIGAGAFAAAFAAHCPRDLQLTGVDVSAEMLRHAERHLNDRNLMAELLKGDVNSLPFAEGCFDVVLVAHVIEHMADPVQALAELYRVLKPGGILIACVTQRSSAGAYIQLKWRTHRVDAQTALGWLERCGFSNVRTVKLAQSAAARRLSSGYVGCKPSQDMGMD